MSTLHTDVSAALQGAFLTKEDSLILACSGGKDSMVLLHVLLDLGFQPRVAHVNFQLRGADSEADEAFLGDFCAEKKLSFYSTRFSTEQEANEHKESIQMAARRLRYAWLFSLMDELGAKRLITAHHERDQAETMLLNLMRGTGPQGLQGMLLDDGRLMRPMLRSSYEEIDCFATGQKVEFREDKSNASIKYKRNFIRHTLLSPWEEAYPGTVRQFSRSSEIMQEVNVFLNQQFEEVIKEFIVTKGDETHVSFSIKTHPSARLLMRYVLKPYAMEDQAPFVLDTAGRPGAIFKSDSHVLLADRNYWLIKQRGENQQQEAMALRPLASDEGHREFTFGSYKFELRRHEENAWPNDANSILLSREILEQDCYFRHWEEGDRMQPFGMKGSKKLSDIFIDAKVPRLAKEQLPVLCSKNGDILWVPEVKSSEQLRLENSEQADFVLKLKK